MNNVRHHILQSVRLRALAAFCGADILFFSLVNPSHGSSLLVIVGCLLLIITIYLGLRLILDLLGVVVVPMRQPVKQRIAGIITFLVSFILIMQSIGQLSMHDVLAVVPLVIVVYFYLSYTTKKQSHT